MLIKMQKYSLRVYLRVDFRAFVPWTLICMSLKTVSMFSIWNFMITLQKTTQYSPCTTEPNNTRNTIEKSQELSGRME